MDDVAELSAAAAVAGSLYDVNRFIGSRRTISEESGPSVMS